MFNMLPGADPDYHTVIDINTGKALIAGAGFDSWTYRTSFDVSLPLLTPYAISTEPSPKDKTHLVLSSQMNLYHDLVTDLQDLADANDKLLLLQSCHDEDEPANHTIRCQYKTGNLFSYPEVLKHAHFCVIGRGVRLAQPSLLEALSVGCIPVIVIDSIVMPFKSVIDWHRVAIFIPEDNLNTLVTVLTAVSKERREEMTAQAKWLFDRYFSSIEQMTTTVLDIMNDRVFPLMAKSYEHWNMPPNPVSYIIIIFKLSCIRMLFFFVELNYSYSKC